MIKKVFEVIKKYLVITFVLSITILTWAIVSMIRSNTLPTVNLLYIMKGVFSILVLTVILVPLIAMIDLFIISATLLFKDFKEADRKGRITIIVILIILLLRKIVIWTR